MTDKKQIIESTAFKAQKAKYKLWSDFCNGGDAVESNTDYLPQHTYESDKQYKIRLALATYKNHARPIVSVFNSAIWRKSPDREGLPNTLTGYVENVDNFGTGADMFFRDISRAGAETGVHLVLVDSTQAPEGEEVKTKKDSLKYNVRPYFVSVPALCVVSWGFDDTGLSFLVVKEYREEAVDAFTEPTQETYYKIWTRQGWELWKETDKEGLILDSSGTHPCGEVPLVACYFKKLSEMVGESAIADVVSILKRAYNMENALDKSLFDTAFPQQAFFGFDPDQIDGYIRASSNALVTSDPGASSKFIEPEGRAFEALDKKVKNDEIAIREIALRMLRTDSKVGESAESKKIDNQQLHSQLSVFSQNCEEAESRCWELMLRWLGDKTTKVEVKYHDDFDVETVSGELIKAFSEMRRNKDITRETLWKMLQKAEIQFPDDFDPDMEKEALDNELRSAGSMGGIGSSFLTGTGK